jgi:hypothetical protein
MVAWNWSTSSSRNSFFDGRSSSGTTSPYGQFSIFERCPW